MVVDKKVEERAEEIRGGESEPALEVSNENHPLTGLRGGDQLITGSAANDLGADPARLIQPLDVESADLRAFPAARGKLGHIQFRSCKETEVIRLGMGRCRNSVMQ